MPKLNYLDLSGGMNSKTSPLFIKNSECELVQNYHMDNLGSLTKRDGIVYLIGQIVDTKSVLGMYYFDDIQGTDYSNVLIAIDDATSTNSDIFKITTNAWASSKADDTAGAIPTFCSFMDYVFRTNGSDVIISSTDLATWSTTHLTNFTTMKPKYCWVWEDRVYAAYENGTTKYPSRIFWSSLGTYGSTLSWNTAANGQWADINPDDNDEIVWGLPFGKQSLIFKTESIYTWTFGQTEADKLIEVGTPTGLTVKITQGFCFFTNKYGVYAYVGTGKPQLISKKVQDFIDAIPTTNLSLMRAEVDNDHYYLYIGDVTVSGVSYSNVMLVYTISLKSWHIETYPFEIKFMARFKRNTLGTTEIYDNIYLGDDDGFIYRKGTGNQDYLGTAARTINGRILTKEYPLLDFPNDSTLKKMFVLAQKGVGAKVNYRINRGDWRAWKDLTERVTEGRIAGIGKTLQLSITDNSISQSQIEGFSFEILGEKGEKGEKRT